MIPAYLDPGSGSMIAQFLAAVMIAILAVAGGVRARVLRFVRRLFKGGKK